MEFLLDIVRCNSSQDRKVEEEEEERREGKNGISSCIGLLSPRGKAKKFMRSFQELIQCFTSSKRFQKQRSFFPRGIYEVAVVEARANKVTRGPLWSASLQFLASPRRFLLSPPPSLSLFLPPKINAPRKTRTGWHVAENTTAPRPLPVRFLTKAMILRRGDPGEGGREEIIKFRCVNSEGNDNRCSSLWNK